MQYRTRRAATGQRFARFAVFWSVLALASAAGAQQSAEDRAAFLPKAKNTLEDALRVPVILASAREVALAAERNAVDFSPAKRLGDPSAVKPVQPLSK